MIDPARRIANRRSIIAQLRQSADEMEAQAQGLREKAERLERSTDELEWNGR